VFLPWLEEPVLNSRHYEDDVGPLFSATICKAEQAGNPDSSGTPSQSIGNASHDTGTPSHIKSGYVTIIKVQINLPEIHIQKVQNPIVLKLINWI